MVEIHHSMTVAGLIGDVSSFFKDANIMGLMDLV